MDVCVILGGPRAEGRRSSAWKASVSTTPSDEPAASPPIVRVSTGTVRGGWEAGTAVFRGIPCAAAPVGSLRLASPRPAPRWDGVREATAFGPPPPQSTFRGARIRSLTHRTATG